MKLQQFITGRNANYEAVRQYIKRNPALFKGHIGKQNNIELDDYAVQLLDKKYPMTTPPVQVIEDTAARQELANLKDKMSQLYDKYYAIIEENHRLMQDNANLMLMQHKQLLLEQDNKKLQLQKEKDRETIDWQKEQLEQHYKTIELINGKWNASIKENETLKNKLIELQNELEEEKNKPWWKKLRR